MSLGQGGAITVYVGQTSGTTHVVLDVNGYFTSGDACSIWQAPPPPPLGVNTGGQCGLLGPQMVTRSDPEFVGVASPFDASSFSQCGKCYYVDVTSVNGQCESPLHSDLGQSAPIGFSFLPCTP